MYSFDPMRSSRSIENQVVELSNAQIPLATVVEESIAEVIKKTSNEKVQDVYVSQKAVAEKEGEKRGNNEERGNARIYLPFKKRLTKKIIEKTFNEKVQDTYVSQNKEQVVTEKSVERPNQKTFELRLKDLIKEVDEKTSNNKKAQSVHRSQKVVVEKEIERPSKVINKEQEDLRSFMLRTKELMKEAIAEKKDEKQTDEKDKPKMKSFAIRAKEFIEEADKKLANTTKTQEVWQQNQGKIAAEKPRKVIKNPGSKKRWTKEEQEKLRPYMRGEKRVTNEEVRLDFPGRTLNAVNNQMSNVRCYPEYSKEFAKLYPEYAKERSEILEKNNKKK